MTDIVDNNTRSRMMASIKSKDTKPELLVRRFLHSRGFRYQLHVKKLPSSPDIVLTKSKLVILVHGCFWHRHVGCKLASIPDQNRQKWEEKFRRNIDRDARQIQLLLDDGWRVLVIWECGLRSAVQNLVWLDNFVKNDDTRFAEWPVVGMKRDRYGDVL